MFGAHGTTGFRFTARMSSWLNQSATAVALGIFFILSAIAPAQSQAPRSPTPAPLTGNLQVESIVKGLENPWGLAFLPDGRMLITEGPGRMRTVECAGRLSEPLERVPQVLARGQGGLLDVAADPRFPENRLVYISYSEPEGNGAAGTSVARGRLGEAGLEDVQVIYRQQPKVSGPNHFGSRLVFARDGSLFVTQGDRFAYREQAQDLSSGIGKIVRIIRTDRCRKTTRSAIVRGLVWPEIWSYGHRNIQSAAIDPQTGQLWTVEHGARGGDELNHPEAGKNYGWPIITYGIDYSGAKIGEGTAKPGMEQPVYYWDPVIAPSGIIFYTGDVFPDRKGSILVGSLNPGLLVRLTMKGPGCARRALP